MTRILAVADLHLGASPDFGRAPYGPESRLADQRGIWEHVNHLALSERCDLILFAGDAFHRRRPSPSELVAFRAGLDQSHGTPTIAIDGNHDVTTPELPSALSIFDDRDNGIGWFRLSRTPEVIEVAGVSVATLPWAPAARLIAARDGGDRDEANADVAQILLDIARQLRAECPPDRPAILLAHWAVSGAALPTGISADDLREPVIPLHDLEAVGFDRVVLGHLHKHQVLDPHGRIGYCGSPCVIDWGEANERHGVWVIDTDLHVSQGSRFVPIEDRPFATIEYDFAGDPDASFEQDAANRFYGDVDGAVVRVRYRATREQAARIDNNQIAQALLSAGAWRVFVQPDIIRQDRARVEGLDDHLTPAQALDLWLDLQQLDDATMAGRVRAQTAAYLEQVAT